MEPAKAIEMGIAVVYQELIQFEAMSVADNIFMGVKEYQGLVLNDRAREKKAAELLAEFDCHVSPSARIRELSIANRQIVELTKAMVRNAKVIIMDEPTAAITVSEQESLFKLVDKLKANKVTVIYISHRLDELFRICDRVSILRDGQYVTTKDIKDTSKQELINFMVGRELSNTYPEKKPAEEEVVLSVKDLSGNGVRNINFDLHKGEILGFAGLVGAGRTELMHLIFGAARFSAPRTRTAGISISKGRRRSSLRQRTAWKRVLLSYRKTESSRAALLTNRFTGIYPSRRSTISRGAW